MSHDTNVIVRCVGNILILIKDLVYIYFNHSVIVRPGRYVADCTTNFSWMLRIVTYDPHGIRVPS